jgi:uncharacterized protein
MINPKSIAFDIDGVFADIMPLFLDIAKKDYNITDIKIEDITEYILEDCLNIDTGIVENIINKILNGDYDFEVKPIGSSAEVLTKIGKKSGELVFVTARPNVGHMREWIFNQLYELSSNKIEIIATGTFSAKTEVLISKNKKYFVEDRLETCFDIHKAGITPVLYKQPWNRKPHPFIEVATWDELESLINFHSE